MRTPYPWLNPSREFLEALRLWAGYSLGGLLFWYVSVAFLLGDAGWVVP